MKERKTQTQTATAARVQALFENRANQYRDDMVEQGSDWSLVADLPCRTQGGGLCSGLQWAETVNDEHTRASVRGSLLYDTGRWTHAAMTANDACASWFVLCDACTLCHPLLQHTHTHAHTPTRVTHTRSHESRTHKIKQAIHVSIIYHPPSRSCMCIDARIGKLKKSVSA